MSDTTQATYQPHQAQPSFQIPTEAKNEKSYRRFIDSCRSTATKHGYDCYLTRYMNFLNVTSYDKLLEGEDIIVESRIIDFITSTKDITNSSKAVYLSGIKRFYEMNRRNLSWTLIQRYLGEKERVTEDKPYTEEQMLQMFTIADLREKVLLSLLASSGIRRGGIPTIKRRHLHKINNNYRITVYAKTKQQYTTFCTAEATALIDAYFKFRLSSGEIDSQDAPLVRTVFDHTDRLKAAHPRAVKPSGIVDIIRNLAIRAGIRKIESTNTQPIYKSKLRKENMLIHAFRKFANTQMAKAQVYPPIKESLLGHKHPLDQSYLKPTDDDLLKEYLKAEQLLTIDPSNRLQKRVAMLEEEKDTLIHALETRLANMEKHIDLADGMVRLFNTNRETVLHLLEEIKKGEALSKTPEDESLLIK